VTLEDEQFSQDDLATLTALRKAVNNALERKRRLGQYAVVWRDGKPALLDEDVEDRAAFYEAMSKAEDCLQNSKAAANPQAGVVDSEGEYHSDNE